MRLKAQYSAIKSGALPFSSDKVKKMEQIFNAFYGFTVNSVDLDGDVAADMAEVFLDYKYQCLL